MLLGIFKVHTKRNIKQYIPLLFLVFTSFSWGLYYSFEHALNDYGQANFEWLYLLDILIVLPVLCFLCINSKKEAAIKALALSCLAVFIGSFIIPDKQQFILGYLELSRYAVLAIFLIFEVSAFVTIYLAITSILKDKKDPDYAIESVITNKLGNGFVSRLLIFETRMWLFLFCGHRITKDLFDGDEHFSYHNKDGAQSNAIGFLLVILLELPIMHIVLHFLWSPFAANVISALTALSLVFFFAEYRAMSRRAIAIKDKTLLIRFGIYNTLAVPLSNIEAITSNNQFIKRKKNIRRFNFAGVPNVRIKLIKEQLGVCELYLGVDSPNHLISSVSTHTAETNKE